MECPVKVVVGNSQKMIRKGCKVIDRLWECYMIASKGGPTQSNQLNEQNMHIE
jgi:hypothetical protein